MSPPEITRSTPKEALPELLLIGEAAVWLGIGKTLCYEMAKDGRIPAVRLGRLIRIKREGLIAMADGLKK